MGEHSFSHSEQCEQTPRLPLVPCKHKRINRHEKPKPRSNTHTHTQTHTFTHTCGNDHVSLHPPPWARSQMPQWLAQLCTADCGISREGEEVPGEKKREKRKRRRMTEWGRMEREEERMHPSLWGAPACPRPPEGSSLSLSLSLTLSLWCLDSCGWRSGYGWRWHFLCAARRVCECVPNVWMPLPALYCWKLSYARLNSIRIVSCDIVCKMLVKWVRCPNK